MQAPDAPAAGKPRATVRYLALLLVVLAAVVAALWYDTRGRIGATQDEVARRLRRADRPQFLPVRRALTRDIDRLRSLPALDVPGLSLAIDRLVASVDALPLAFEERVERSSPGKPAAAGKSATASAAEEGFFTRLWAEIWKELRQLIVVRKVESPEPPLLPPQQAYFL